jgi:hypothetical protein
MSASSADWLQDCSLRPGTAQSTESGGQAAKTSVSVEQSAYTVTRTSAYGALSPCRRGTRPRERPDQAQD